MGDTMPSRGLQRHFDAATAALHDDSASREQYEAAAAGVRAYSQRRIAEALGDAVDAFRRAFAGGRTRAEPAKGCCCLCGAVHPGRLGICAGTAATSRTLRRRTEGGAAAPVCDPCAAEHDAFAEGRGASSAVDHLAAFWPGVG